MGVQRRQKSRSTKRRTTVLPSYTNLNRGAVSYHTVTGPDGKRRSFLPRTKSWGGPSYTSCVYPDGTVRYPDDKRRSTKTDGTSTGVLVLDPKSQTSQLIEAVIQTRDHSLQDMIEKFSNHQLTQAQTWKLLASIGWTKINGNRPAFYTDPKTKGYGTHERPTSLEHALEISNKLQVLVQDKLNRDKQKLKTKLMLKDATKYASRVAVPLSELPRTPSVPANHIYYGSLPALEDRKSLEAGGGDLHILKGWDGPACGSKRKKLEISKRHRTEHTRIGAQRRNDKKLTSCVIL